MHVLLINHYAGSPRHGMEYRPFYLAREWVRLGHQVTIIAASFSHLRVSAPSLSGRMTEEYIDGIRYVWLKTPSYQGNGVRRALNMLSFVSQLRLRYKQILKDSPPQVVIASSTYPLDIYPARRIARRYGARLIYEVHDLWPLSLIELAGMSTYHPFIVLLQHAENYACRHADRVVSMLPKAEQHLRQHGMAEHKFVYVPNGIDPDEWSAPGSSLPESHQQPLDRLRSQGQSLIAYAGAHGLANALATVVEAAQLLTSIPVTFVLLGQGPEKENLVQRANSLGLQNVLFLPAIPRAAVPTFLERMDALYIGLQRQPLFRFGVSPNKLMDYMMASKPVIHAIDAGNDLVAESGCGISCPPEDPSALAAAVKSLLQLDPKVRQTMGTRGHRFVLDHHTYPVLARRFLEAMN